MNCKTESKRKKQKPIASVHVQLIYICTNDTYMACMRA